MVFSQNLTFCGEKAFNIKEGALELMKIVTNDYKFLLDIDDMKCLQ
jgi:hypothetical protein